MLANNETGAIQAVRDIAAAAQAVGALIHADAAQAVGKIPVDVTDLDVDLLTVVGQARIVNAQMPGDMLIFVLDGDGAAAAAVVDRLTLFAIAPSLGAVESIVTQPITTTHHGVAPDERRARGIANSMIRLSIGLEDAADLIKDLDQALAVAM
jgi:cystathionine gamma-synthase/methionine-gamma-lyase